jgi:hypothetical protein
MTEGTIYAHLVESGVKIGWSTDYKQRKRSYMSHGDIIREIALATADQKYDQIIKLALADQRIKINDQSSTEVYQITDTQAKEILTYLHKNKTINARIITNILSPGSAWCIEKIKLADIKTKYGNLLIPFKFQREPTIKHIDEIRDYILTCYMEPWFRIPEVTFCHDAKSEVREILDGNHRCLAISQLPADHPALSMYVNCSTALLTDVEKIRVFRDLNKSKPMPDIYVRDNYIAYYTEKVTTLIATRYGAAVTEKSKLSAKPFVEKITEFINSENIILLINLNEISGIGYRELYTWIVSLNDLLIQVYNFVNEAPESHQLTGLDCQTVWQAICELNTASYPLKDFNEALVEINRGINKKIKHKFLLNLLPKLKIIDIKPRIQACYEM